MLLGVNRLTKQYRGSDGRVDAVSEVSLEVDAGQFVAIRGPSGCGKTSLLLSAGGLLRPDEGSVVVEGQDLYSLSSEQRARFRARRIGFVFQQFHLVPYLSVLDNVLVPSMAWRVENANERARELLETLGMSHRLHHKPDALSTGERQRTALARALLNRPGLLLADEPTGNLDRENADGVLQFLTQFAHDGGAVLLVTHDDYAMGFADRTIKMREGRFQSATEEATIS
jgi:putative ABC transport system ATP-binding protein